MGAWGTGIFEDDVACDVRDDFKELIAEGVSVREATQRLMKQYDLEDHDDGPTFWLALAAIQLELGQQQDSVKNEALRVIDEGTDLARWQEEAPPQDAESRRVVLEGLRKKLFATQT